MITNLTELSSDEIDLLKLGMNYEIASPPTEEEMICVMEEVWEQISKKQLVIIHRYQVKSKQRYVLSLTTILTLMTLWFR